MALGDIDLHCVWQAWHFVTSTFTLCDRRGTYGTGLALVACLHLFDAVVAAAVCVAGVALGDIQPHLAWQAWHLVMDLHFCVAGVALCDIDVHFVWQAWHLWHWAGSGGALGSRLTPLSPRLFVWQAWHLETSAFTLRGRRGTW